MLINEEIYSFVAWIGEKAEHSYESAAPVRESSGLGCVTPSLETAPATPLKAGKEEGKEGS